MQLRIKQRAFAWGDTYDIFNESGDAKYFVKQKMLTLGKQIYLYDKGSDEELGAIKEKLFSLLPTFKIFVKDREMGEVRREFTLLSQRYSIDYLGWEVEGDFFGFNFTVRKADRVLMSVSKQVFEFTDTYVLDYDDPAIELPGLLLALSIDAVKSKND